MTFRILKVEPIPPTNSFEAVRLVDPETIAVEIRMVATVKKSHPSQVDFEWEGPPFPTKVYELLARVMSEAIRGLPDPPDPSDPRLDRPKKAPPEPSEDTRRAYG